MPEIRGMDEGKTHSYSQQISPKKECLFYDEVFMAHVWMGVHFIAKLAGVRGEFCICNLGV